MTERSGVTWRWNGGSPKAAARPIQDELDARVRLAAETLRGAIVESIGESTREHGPSLPGTPPHADTGRLRQSVFAVDNGDGSATIGAAARYAGYLEAGTTRMDPRPFLVPALLNNQHRLERILGFPLHVDVNAWE
ncbi:MAG: hypothetical protein RBS80_12890 [Thermoguttaceae bacterium]|jgi:HK97 gp10 family phage protein|nr:hypothetical protein [Thermoguttaceae bacterium]